VAFGVGGAALVGATVLLLTGSSSDSSEPSSEAQLVPSFTPDFAGINLSGHF
jgi:hypothetical protein